MVLLTWYTTQNDLAMKLGENDRLIMPEITLFVNFDDVTTGTALIPAGDKVVGELEFESVSGLTTVITLTLNLDLTARAYRAVSMEVLHALGIDTISKSLGPTVNPSIEFETSDANTPHYLRVIFGKLA